MTRALLLMLSGTRLCALPHAYVAETMRPLPITALSGAPSFVRGVSIVRGQPVPIVDLSSLLGEALDGSPTRLVTVKPSEGRLVGLLVDSVLGLYEESAVSEGALPPLLDDEASEVIAELAPLDGRLLSVLRAGRLVPPDIWDRLIEARRAT